VRCICSRAVGGLAVLLIIAMRSSVDDPLLHPSIPLTLSVAVITFIAAFQNLCVYLNVENESAENITHSKVVELIEDEKLLTDNPTEDEVDRNEIFELL